MKKAVVTGAGGFIGSHLVKYLKNKGYWVRGVDIKHPEFESTSADEFILLDLRNAFAAYIATKDVDEVYGLAACYDKDTEILTKHGWKLFDDLTTDEEVATLNTDTNQLEWKIPKQYIKYIYNGSMLHFKSKSIDCMITPNHNMFVLNSTKTKWGFVEAARCKKNYFIKNTSDWHGNEESVFTIETDISYTNATKKIFSFKMDDFLEFLGYYLSEGSTCSKSNGTYVVHLANKDEELIGKMYDVCSRMGFNPYIDRSGSYGISFCSKIIVDYLKQFGLAQDKFIPTELKDLSRRQLKILFDSLWAGDGLKNGNSYSSVSKTLIGDIQEIAIKLGFSTTVSIRKRGNDGHQDIYIMYISNRSKINLGKPEFIEYNDYVYCVEVENHIIMTRRNGRTIWCGNCMGGMGFLQKNGARILHDNAVINFNTVDAARFNEVERYFYSSSACVYNEAKQLDTNITALKEGDAYPAYPDLAYGWEKLITERLCKYYREDYGLETRIARFHNIFGHEGSWTGGKEKAPAALCRKVAEAKLTGKDYIEIWGDGEQTRSFCFIDDCVEGIYRLTHSEYHDPVNIGSSRLISINAMADIIMHIAGVQLEKQHIDGPQGVRGRNSDNTLVKQVLNWEPSTTLEQGLTVTYNWIEEQVKKSL